MSYAQQTIQREVSISGIGIHTGEEATVTFKPAEAGYGVRFVRVDLPDRPEIPADITYVTDVERGTTLQKDSAKVQTVEHLLATAISLGIDNLIVEIDKSELPVGDGSANEYTMALLKAGIKKQDQERKYYTPSKILRCRTGKSEFVVIPSDSFSVSVTIHYGFDFLHSQFYETKVTPEVYINDISPARTYCLENEINLIKEMGLGKGGNFDNTVVVTSKGIKNTSLRFKEEFARHKVLDLIGDLSLIGMPIKAHIIAIRCGHSSNIELARKLKKDMDKNGCGRGSKVMDIGRLMSILPHRYPFLLVDRIEVDSEKFARGFKNVTVNEPFFKGHFPDNPILPPVLIIEFMAQSSAVMLLSKPDVYSKLAYFIIIEKAEFFGDVRPCDMLQSKVELVRARARGSKVRGEAYVGERKVAEAEFMFSLIDK